MRSISVIGLSAILLCTLSLARAQGIVEGLTPNQVIRAAAQKCDKMTGTYDDETYCCCYNRIFGNSCLKPKGPKETCAPNCQC